MVNIDMGTVGMTVPMFFFLFLFLFTLSRLPLLLFLCVFFLSLHLLSFSLSLLTPSGEILSISLLWVKLGVSGLGNLRGILSTLTQQRDP